VNYGKQSLKDQDWNNYQTSEDTYESFGNVAHEHSKNNIRSYSREDKLIEGDDFNPEHIQI
jgi:hypothetical protein